MVSVVFRLRKPFSDLAHGFNVRNTFEELSIVLRQPIFDSNLGDVVPRFQFSRSLFRGLHSRFRLLLVCHLRRFQFLRSRPQALYLLFLGSERRHKRVVVRELDRLAARPVVARLCPDGAIGGHSLFVSVFGHCYSSQIGWLPQTQFGWGRIKTGVLAHLIHVGARPGAVLIKQLLRLRITSSGTLTQLIDALRRHIGAHGHFFSGLIPRRRGTRSEERRVGKEWRAWGGPAEDEEKCGERSVREEGVARRSGR